MHKGIAELAKNFGMGEMRGRCADDDADTDEAEPPLVAVVRGVSVRRAIADVCVNFRRSDDDPDLSLHTQAFRDAFFARFSNLRASRIKGVWKAMFASLGRVWFSYVHTFSHFPFFLYWSGLCLTLGVT